MGAPACTCADGRCWTLISRPTSTSPDSAVGGHRDLPAGGQPTHGHLVTQRAGTGGHDSLASAALDRHLRDRAPVLRCYGCAILAPSQQVRLRSARCLRPQQGRLRYGTAPILDQRHPRRLLLLWQGDILHAYAVVGLVVLLRSTWLPTAAPWSSPSPPGRESYQIFEASSKFRHAAGRRNAPGTRNTSRPTVRDPLTSTMAASRWRATPPSHPSPSDPNQPEPTRSDANHAGTLEQILTPFRARGRHAPDLLQLGVQRGWP
jgi:hypothetical protein